MVVVSETAIQQKILVVHGIPVMLDSDLALLYQIEKKNLKRQVRRNLNRFPSDFMFELSDEEAIYLRRQNVTSKKDARRCLRLIVFDKILIMRNL